MMSWLRSTRRLNKASRGGSDRMATLSAKAKQQARLLAAHFGARDREQAKLHLRRAIAQACTAADDNRLRTKAFPAAYRDLGSLGFRWFKFHRYWFAIEET